MQQSSTPITAGWDRAGKRSMLRCPVTDVDVATEFVRWLKWDARASNLFRRMCHARVQALRQAYYEMAHNICRNYSDIGVPSKFVKQVAESTNDKRKRAKMSPEDKAVADAAAKRRQAAAPASFVEILKWVAKKRGCCVHVIDPWMSSRRCYVCQHDNPQTIEEHRHCLGCGSPLHQDTNASHHAFDFACECLGDDGNTGECSHDGKSKPHVGFGDSPSLAKWKQAHEKSDRSQIEAQGDEDTGLGAAESE